MSGEYKRKESFKEFYPYYLSEHQNLTCRRLHFIGTLLIILLSVYSSFTSAKYLLLLPVVGYGFAWIGHFIFEKNRPATFKQPIYSLMGDFKMFWEILTSKIKF